MQPAEGFVGVELAEVGMVDDRLEAEIAAVVDQQADRLARAKAARVAVQVTLEARRRDDPVRARLGVDADRVGVALAHRLLLLGEWHQQVLRQAPVEERADAIAADDLQIGAFADLDLRRLRRRDDAILGVAVEKRADRIAGVEPGGEALRQQDFAELAGVDEGPDVGAPRHAQVVESSQVRHSRIVHRLAVNTSSEIKFRNRYFTQMRRGCGGRGDLSRLPGRRACVRDFSQRRKVRQEREVISLR